MANWNWVFIDHTTDATPAALKPAQAFAQFVEDIGWGLAHEWADEWGAEGYAFRIASGPDDRQAGEVACNFRDDLEEAPGAEAYHQDTNGVPDIEIGCTLFPDLFGTDGVMKGLDHEIKEMLLDPGANLTADLGNGTCQALEACDLVQNTQYKAGTGAGAGYLSNFLRKAAFIPGAQGPWDYLNVMTNQNDVSNGYQILMNSPQPLASGRKGTNIIQAYGLEAMPELVRKRKARSMRMARRGFLIQVV